MYLYKYSFENVEILLTILDEKQQQQTPHNSKPLNEQTKKLLVTELP